MSERDVLKGADLDSYIARGPYKRADLIPYADEMVGNYVVKDWQRLSDAMANPDITVEQKNELRRQRAVAYMESVHNSDVYIGPVRERELGPMLGTEPAPIEPTPLGRIERAKNWLKGHFENAKDLWKEHKLVSTSAILLGIAGGAMSIATSHQGAEYMINLMADKGLANPMLDLLVGASINIGGNYLLNKKLFLDTIVKGRVAPWMAKHKNMDEHGIEDATAALGEEIENKIKIDEKRIMSTVVLADISTKMVLGTLFPLASMVRRIGESLKSMVAGSSDIDITPGPDGDLPAASEHILTNGAHLNGDEGGLTMPNPISHPGDPGWVDGPSPVFSDNLPVSGVEYIIKPDDQMLQVLLDQNVTDHVYSSSATIDFLKLNQDALLEAWANKYGSNGVPMRDDAGKWVRYSIDQMRQIIDDVIARGGTPSQEWSQTMRKPFNDIMNALRGIPAGTKVILPEAK